ncbi:hypothetical protein ARMGADRAFT_1089030 [Armillaria gallica]|uniref:Uncharacterized protein n=1 Tax=Armillaria gallica TaxID=47427 RepID=A0A2H3CQY2_ARMGA|nr:hypothetical protein ARMGADRAFT_1089030 [Armillaria gallica]
MHSAFSSTSEPFRRLYVAVHPVLRCQDKDTFPVDPRLTVAEAPAEMEEEPLRSRSPVPVVEDKLTAVQALRKIASKGTDVKPPLQGLVLVPAQGSQPCHGVPCAGSSKFKVCLSEVPCQICESRL